MRIEIAFLVAMAVFSGTAASAATDTRKLSPGEHSVF